VWDRVILNFAVTYAYYILSWGLIFVAKYPKRKFNKDHWASAGELAHDIWYLTLGTIQWCGWEVIFMRLWATGLVPYVSSAELLSSPTLLLQSTLGFLLVPVWRGLHFYTAHRFIHIRAVYKFVHSLHHRNTDPNPWSGLAMHPIEHMYYYSCVGPHLFLSASPLLLLFNGMHLLLSPACSHSGWEDHWQSDQFHFVHHARFECNYGGSHDFLDKMFGTFYDRYHPTASSKKTSSTTPATSLVPSSLPSTDHLCYSLFTASLFFIIWQMCVFVANEHTNSGLDFLLAYFRTHPEVFGFFVGFGPLIAAFVLWASTRDSLSPRWPFQKEAIVGAFGFHFTFGTLIVAMPVYTIAYLLAIS